MKYEWRHKKKDYRSFRLYSYPPSWITTASLSLYLCVYV
jgi:hypothetical protein